MREKEREREDVSEERGLREREKCRDRQMHRERKSC